MLLSTLCSNKAFYLLVFLYCAVSAALLRTSPRFSLLPFLGAAAPTISTIFFCIPLVNRPLDFICNLFFYFFPPLCCHILKRSFYHACFLRHVVPRSVTTLFSSTSCEHRFKAIHLPKTASHCCNGSLATFLFNYCRLLQSFLACFATHFCATSCSLHFLGSRFNSCKLVLNRKVGFLDSA